LFPSAQKQNDLASLLVDAMQNGAQASVTGELLAPNLYTLLLHPSQAKIFYENQLLIEGLTQTLREAGAELGFHFPSPPVIRITEAPAATPGEIRVIAKNSQENLPQTSDMEAPSSEDANAIPKNAFVIVDGMHVVPLEYPVINIGRRQDNQLVIEDPRVSRVHAQLRAVKGHYVIFDLDSTGGTGVNGKPIHQCRLYPGDVISLSGVPLVYGQDPSAHGETQDMPFSPNGHSSDE
jgi:hypothetical protein